MQDNEKTYLSSIETKTQDLLTQKQLSDKLQKKYDDMRQEGERLQAQNLSLEEQLS